MLKNLRKYVEEKKVVIKLCEQTKETNKKKLSKLESELESLQEAREVFKKASKIVQNNLVKHLSSIVTKAIKTVFYEKDISFHMEFIERRNTIEADMWIEEDGYKYSILDSRGYSVVDVISFSLKVAYVLLQTTDNILIIDEPFRNLAKNKHAIASEMVKKLSTELKTQFLIATHSEELKEYADKTFQVVQKNGISSCY